MIGKLALSAAFNMLYIHTPETMLTELWALGFSLASTSARIGSIQAVYIALLVNPTCRNKFLKYMKWIALKVLNKEIRRFKGCPCTYPEIVSLSAIIACNAMN